MKPIAIPAFDQQYLVDVFQMQDIPDVADCHVLYDMIIIVNGKIVWEKHAQCDKDDGFIMANDCTADEVKIRAILEPLTFESLAVHVSAVIEHQTSSQETKRVSKDDFCKNPISYW